jgi:hypothetical protein
LRNRFTKYGIDGLKDLPRTISSICKQFKPQTAKATQNKLFVNDSQAMEEEDWDFFRLFPIIPDFLRLLPPQSASVSSPKR